MEPEFKIAGVFGFILIAIIAIVLPIAACERVDVGNVGIRINKAGSERGAESIPTVSGYVLYNPFTTTILEYPVYMQTARWERQAEDAGEEICFNSREGLVLCADVSLSFQLEALKVPNFYMKFRSDDIEKFTHGFLRNVTRDAFNEVAGANYAAEQILGEKKEELLNKVQGRVSAVLGDIGVSVQQLGFLNPPRPPKSVTDAINSKIAATQQAVQVENELRRTEAEAKKRVAQVDGEARARLLGAESDAKSRIISAESEARANELLAKSLSPALLDWQRLDVERAAIAKWNGARPMIEGNGAGLQLQIPVKP
jgi:regulator of protease activity HflC (stomatin/prohibitin superfamily)